MSSIYFTKRAAKDIKKLASRDRQKILAHIEELKIPLPKKLDIKAMVGFDQYYRLRSGQIRVIFEVDPVKDEIWIRLVGYRGNVYGKLW